ncbi:DMT family transporter [Nocardia takedensis]|uniref:DMT family transporter n=1 Tax=Nocardia takedensis TaxID=259390 RepID=UPI0002D2AF9C|nr:DMT family transporter [Nocardia takedensis]
MPETTTLPTAARVDIALLAVAVTWGSSYAVAKDVVTPDTVFGFLVARFGIAVAALSIPLIPSLRRTTRAECGLGVVFGAILAAILVLETSGVTRTSAANAGLIISLTMVITPLLDRPRELPRAFHAATGAAVLGVVLLTQGSGFALPGLGDLLVLLAACTRALHVTAIARLTAGREHDTSRMTLIQLATVLAVAAPLAEIHGAGLAPTLASMTAPDWLRTAYLALACTIFAFYAQMWAVRHTSPSRVGLLLGTEPVWALTCGLLLVGEALTPTGLLGAALVLAGTTWGRGIDTALRARPTPVVTGPPPGSARPGSRPPPNGHGQTSGLTTRVRIANGPTRPSGCPGREYGSVRDSGRRYWGGRCGCPWSARSARSRRNDGDCTDR